MSNLLNLIPPIRRHRMHKIRVMLDPVYEAKSKELDEYRGALFRWTLKLFVSKTFLLQAIGIWIPLVVFVWKVNILFVLIFPTIILICSILISIHSYLTLRKELKIDD